MSEVNLSGMTALSIGRGVTLNNAAELEAALRDGDPADALAWLGTAVAQARAAIADMLGVA